MRSKATPRRQPGTQHDVSTTDLRRFVARIVPFGHLVHDYIALAALLHHADLAAPFVTRLRPAHWAITLHQIAARIALAHLQLMGRVDYDQLVDMILDADTLPPGALQIELATLGSVAGQIHTERIVADAVAVLTGHNREVAA